MQGGEAVENLLNTELVAQDSNGVLGARLAETVPTVENGLWKVFPDGRMETTWKIRADARWHDATPFTADDLVFTARLVMDRELGVFRVAIFDSVEGVEALDARTVVVKWKRTHIYADTPFQGPATPYPRHLLEKDYLEKDRAGFLSVPYWGPALVGTGPFRLKEFVPGSHVLLQANDDYVLGRPKIDEIVVKFIPDASTLIANILAGAVEMTIGRNVSLDEAIQVRDQYRAGRVEVGPANWIAIYPQFLNPNPAIVADVRFRRALMHALDRQTMVDTLQAGFGSVAHSLIPPEEPEFQGVERNVVRYEYDPRKASELVAQLGYVKGPDGVFRDRSNEPLAIEIRTRTQPDQQKPMLAAVDYWKAIGLSVNPHTTTAAEAVDRQFRANFPAFELAGGGRNTLDGLAEVRISEVPLPSNNYVGANTQRYANAELDDLAERYFTTVPKRERAELAARALAHISEQLVWMGVYLRVEPAFMANRLVNVYPRRQPAPGGIHVWNAHEWDLK